MSNTANETTQPTEAPLWREARYHGQMWREEYSDIKLESTLQFLGRSRMTRKCHVRICRRARRHNEGLSLTHPQYYHPVSICFGLAFCKYRSGVRCFWQPTSKRVLQRRTAGSAADHESIQRARTTRRRNCLNFCSFCFEETTTWPIVATLPSGEKLIGAQRAALVFP